MLRGRTDAMLVPAIDTGPMTSHGLEAPIAHRRPGGVPPAAVRALARESVVVAAAMIAYFAVRNLTEGSTVDAARNAGRLADLERWLGIAWEHALQSVVVGSDLLTTLANWVYIWGHWPVILVSAVVLFLVRRTEYYALRNAIVLSGLIGFAFFALFPVAPPRLVDPALIDTVTEHSEAYRTLQPPGLTNQYAAFPSLHVGWNLLVGLALFRAFTHTAVRVFALATPVLMAFAVVTTANHWLVDVPAGIAVVLVARRLTETGRGAQAATLVSDGWRRG